MAGFIDDGIFDYAVGIACETWAPHIRDEAAKQRCVELARDHQAKAEQKHRAAEAEMRLRAEMGVEDDDRIG